MTARKKIWIAAGVITVLVLFAIPAYQPLKFRYAIWRFETAANPEQERTACVLATRVGHLWEVNDIHPNEFSSLPATVNPRTNDIVTEIQWWESPWREGMGQPCRAYRVLLGPKNRELLVVKSK